MFWSCFNFLRSGATFFVLSFTVSRLDSTFSLECSRINTPGCAGGFVVRSPAHRWSLADEGITPSNHVSSFLPVPFPSSMCPLPPPVVPRRSSSRTTGSPLPARLISIRRRREFGAPWWVKPGLTCRAGPIWRFSTLPSYRTDCFRPRKRSDMQDTIFMITSLS